MDKFSALRSLPKIDELLYDARIQALMQTVPRSVVLSALRDTVAQYRDRICAGQSVDEPSSARIIDEAVLLIQSRIKPNLRPVVNAAGIVLHTNLGRARLSESAAQAVLSTARGYSNLEYDLEQATRGSRYVHVAGLLKELSQAPDALVVNNNAAAVLLILNTFAKGKNVILSRGEMVEIGGSFRVPEIMEQSGSKLIEVGTTNKTRLSDYENAIDDQTALLLKIHTSNFRIVGFTEEVSLPELVALGKKHGIPVMHDQGSGAMIDLQKVGIADEPNVLESVQAGADLISFSGDKLLGGPQAGIVLGKEAAIERLKKNPLTRALRIDKLSLAALEATLRDYLHDDCISRIPTLEMISASRDVLHQKALRLLAKAQAHSLPAKLNVEAETGYVGGGSVPGHGLESFVLSIMPHELSLALLEKRLRLLDRPIIARIGKDRLLLDVRTIDESDFDEIANGLEACLAPSGMGE